MKFNLLKRSLNIDFQWKKYSFNEPTIKVILEIEELIEDKDVTKIPKIVDLLIPWNNIKMGIKVIYLSDIIKLVFKEVYWDDFVKDVWKKQEWDSKNDFFPSTIMFYAELFWVLPWKLIESVTMTQLITYSAGKEWNNNIINKQEHKNRAIINRQMSNDEVEAAKDRIRQIFNFKPKN